MQRVHRQSRIGRKNIPNIFFDHLIKKENRRVIRLVGTLLWYSIDWGQGGERKTNIRKSLRELEDLTQIDRRNVLRAIEEAIEQNYIERVEPGVFDFAGNCQGSVTVYGVRWTTDYTYTVEGEAVEVTSNNERSQKVLRKNAPKRSHRTLPKSPTWNAPKKSL